MATSVSRLPWKEVAWVVAGQVATLAGSLAALKILTTILPAPVYGEVNLVLVSCTLPTLVLLAPLVQSCYRFYAEHDERGTLPVLLGTTIALQIGVVLLVGVVVSIALFSGTAERFGLSPSTVAWGFVLFAADSGRSLCLTVAAAGRKRAIVAAGIAADAWLRVLGAVTFIYLFGQESGSTLAGFAVAGLCSFVPLATWLAVNTNGLRIEGKIVKEIAHYGLPYGLWGIFGWAQAGADRYMVDHWLMRADVGRYAAGSQVGAFPFSIAGAFVGHLLSPVLFQRAGDGTDPERVGSAKLLLLTVVRLFLLFGVVALAFLYFFGPALLGLMTGRPEYKISLAVLMTLSVGGLLFQMAQVCSSMFLIQKKSYLVLWPKIFGGITAVVAGLLFIPGRGLSGAAFASACAAAALLAGHWVGPARKAWRTGSNGAKPGMGESGAGA